MRTKPKQFTTEHGEETSLMEAPFGLSCIRLFSPSLPSDPSERPTDLFSPSIFHFPKGESAGAAQNDVAFRRQSGYERLCNSVGVGMSENNKGNSFAW